jgi:hypothetical protein
MTATGTVDRAVAEAAVEQLYTERGLEMPAIIWCRSFYQLLIMPSLLIGILHSDMWDLLAGDLEKRESDAEWSKFWLEVWPQIWSNAGLPLLDGMRHTSSISRFYGYLEEELISQCEREFGAALRCGRLDRMQVKLKREIYRRFWAPHAGELARDSWALVKRDVYSIWDDLARVESEWPHWEQVKQFDEQVFLQATGVRRFFDTALALRLGGEAALQARFVLDLPSGIPWLATGEFLLNAFPQHVNERLKSLRIWRDLAGNASAVMCLDGMAFVCEKPSSFHLDEQMRLHSAEGPAIAFNDGFREYAWEGVLVPDFVVMDPQSITVPLIEENRNAMVRRVMIERYGMARYMLDAKVTPIQEDEWGTLFRRQLPDDEALVLLRVVNSTPEPDGTYKEYFLRVPPDMETARQAVAWTFDLPPDGYEPLIQT